MTVNRPEVPVGTLRYNENIGAIEMSTGVIGVNPYPNSIGTGISGGGGGLAQWQSVTQQYLDSENSHQFNCTKVENGWTVYYRGKTFIANTIEDMMDQMKAAMVTERISK